jgi:hypothetical protein
LEKEEEEEEAESEAEAFECAQHTNADTDEIKANLFSSLST